MVSDFKYEFNDGGTWQPVAFVDRVEDDANNLVFWYIEVDNGTLHQVKASRGDGNAQFRDRQ